MFFFCFLVIWFYVNSSTNEICNFKTLCVKSGFIDIPEEILMASVWRAWRDFSEVQVADASVGSFKAASATETAIAGNPIQREQNFFWLQASSNPAQVPFTSGRVGVLLYIICVEADINTLPR